MGSIALFRIVLRDSSTSLGNTKTQLMIKSRKPTEIHRVLAMLNPKSEIRNPKEARMTKFEFRISALFRISDFELRILSYR